VQYVRAAPRRRTRRRSVSVAAPRVRRTAHRKRRSIMGFGGFGSSKIISILAGAAAGYFAPRMSPYQDPAIIAGSAVLNSGVVNLGGPMALASGAANGYVLGTLAKYYMSANSSTVSGTECHEVDGGMRVCWAVGK